MCPRVVICEHCKRPKTAFGKFYLHRKPHHRCFDCYPIDFMRNTYDDKHWRRRKGIHEELVKRRRYKSKQGNVQKIKPFPT
jgi:hypothetical protein